MPKRIYVSTVGRGKALEEASRIYCLDGETGALLGSVRLPLAMYDLANPRGGCRGARGMTVYRDSLWAAGFDGLFEIDMETLFIRRGYWSPVCRDIHNIYGTPEGIRVLATGSNSIYLFRDGTFEKVKSFGHLPLGKARAEHESEDTLHLNALCGNLGLLSWAGAIIDTETEEILCRDNENVLGSHDLWRLSSGEIAINASNHLKTLTLDPSTWRVKRELFAIKNRPELDKLARHGWMRGMAYVPEKDLLFVGSSPAMVIRLEKVCGSSRPRPQVFPISDEVVESVFDIVPHPADWR